MSELMVMGSQGMLGSEVVRAASEPRAEHAHVWSGNRLMGLTDGADIADRRWVATALDAFKPEVVINCAGVHATFGRRTPRPERMISANARWLPVRAEHTYPHLKRKQFRYSVRTHAINECTVREYLKGHVPASHAQRNLKEIIPQQRLPAGKRYEQCPGFGHLINQRK